MAEKKNILNPNVPDGELEKKWTKYRSSLPLVSPVSYTHLTLPTKA